MGKYKRKAAHSAAFLYPVTANQISRAVPTSRLTRPTYRYGFSLYMLYLYINPAAKPKNRRDRLPFHALLPLTAHITVKICVAHIMSSSDQFF